VRVPAANTAATTAATTAAMGLVTDDISEWSEHRPKFRLPASNQRRARDWVSKRPHHRRMWCSTAATGVHPGRCGAVFIAAALNRSTSCPVLRGRAVTVAPLRLRSRRPQPRGCLPLGGGRSALICSGVPRTILADAAGPTAALDTVVRERVKSTAHLSTEGAFSTDGSDRSAVPVRRSRDSRGRYVRARQPASACRGIPSGQARGSSPRAYRPDYRLPVGAWG
jgi:hypothetical protein